MLKDGVVCIKNRGCHEVRHPCRNIGLDFVRWRRPSEGAAAMTLFYKNSYLRVVAATEMFAKLGAVRIL